ncbi:MAG: PEGA domain-containing protein [Alkalispirochaeta sp.]
MARDGARLPRLIRWRYSFNSIFLILLPVLAVTPSLYGETVPESGDTLFLESTVTLRSNPAGASVIIDNREIGATPRVDYPLRPGRHKIEIRAPGYLPLREWIDLPAGTEVTREYELRPALRLVRFLGDTEEPLEIYLNGRWRRTESIELRPGRYRVRVRAFGYTPTTVDVAVPEIEPAEIESADADRSGADDLRRERPAPADTPVFGTVEVPVVLEREATIGGSVDVGTRDRVVTNPVPIRIETARPAAVDLVVIAVDAFGADDGAEQEEDPPPAYRDTRRITSRTTEITWPGTIDSGVPAPPGTYRLVITLTAEGARPEVFVRTVEIHDRSLFYPVPLGAAGYGTGSVPLPAPESIRDLVVQVGSGVAATCGTRSRTGIPLTFRVAAAPVDFLFIALTGGVEGDAAREKPTARASATLGTTAFPIGRHLAAAVTVTGGYDETTPPVDADSTDTDDTADDEGTLVIHGDIPFVTRRVVSSRWTVSLVVAPGVYLPFRPPNSVGAVPGDTVPVVGTTIAAYRDAVYLGGSASVALTGRNRREIPLERYSIDLIGRPEGGPFRLFLSVNGERRDETLRIGGELGVGFELDLR